MDFEHPARNDFLVINQFRVDPPWATGNRGYIVPDLVLFVNGIPLVVVEAKRPTSWIPLTEAIDQLLRYSNQRLDVAEPEGAERLFRYAQLMVATCFETARLGTVGAPHKHYLAWKDVYPLQTSEVSENLGGRDNLSQQNCSSPGAAPRARAGHRPQLHPLRPQRRAPQEDRAALPAVPRRPQGHLADRRHPRRGRRARPAKWHHLAHARLRQEPHHGLPDPRIALAAPPAALQDRAHHRPHQTGGAAGGDGGTNRRAAPAGRRYLGFCSAANPARASSSA